MVLWFLQTKIIKLRREEGGYTQTKKIRRGKQNDYFKKKKKKRIYNICVIKPIFSINYN